MTNGLSQKQRKIYEGQGIIKAEDMEHPSNGSNFEIKKRSKFWRLTRFCPAYNICSRQFQNFENKRNVTGKVIKGSQKKKKKKRGGGGRKMHNNML